MLFIPSFKSTLHRVSVPAVAETLLQLINTALCGGGGDGVRDIETERERKKGGHNKSNWELKGKGENKTKKNCPIH